MPVHNTKTGVVLIAGLSEAKVSNHGAHIHSWTVDGEEHLFLSSAVESLAGPAAIRGGIPICFPVFGPPPKEEPYLQLKQHGFARTSRWDFKGSEDGDGFVVARYALEPTEEIRRVFSPPFSVTYTIRLTHSPSPSLTTTLTVLNPPSSSPLRFQALLHSYLRLPGSSRPKDVKVSGLKGASFVDKVGGPKEDKEGRELVGFEAGEVDRVYSNVPSTIEVEYGGGKGITLQTSSLPDLTVWNPAAAKSDAMKDMEANGWERFVCIEPGQTTFFELKAGDSWEGSQTLTPRASKL